MARSIQAIARRREHVEAFEHFADALPKAHVKAWTNQVQDFERGLTSKNPYEPDGESKSSPFIYSNVRPNEPCHPLPVKSETEIRLQLAKEDTDLIKYGNAEMLHPNVSPSVFIYQGLEIEDAQ